MSEIAKNSPSDFFRKTLGTWVAVCVLLMFACSLPARAQMYAGILGGVSTLSGDARSIVDPNATQFSSYAPQNGLVLNGLVGKHLSDIFTVEADYYWNRNALTFAAGAATAGSLVEYQESRSSDQQGLFGNLLVYFRSRSSRFRPYLAVGAGWVHVSSSEQRISVLEGPAPIPPRHFRDDVIGLRVPVGIDVTLRGRWRFRYSFSETISANPISHQLVPAGTHTLKNFQNLFGFVREF